MSNAKKIKRKKMSFGGEVLITAFPSKDVVSIAGSVAGGERYFRSEEVADVHAQMLMEGTTKRSKKDIQEFLDSIGASLSFSAGTDRLHFAAKVRPKYLRELLALIAECITEPAFSEPELAVLKMREAADLQLTAENTTTQATIALTRALYNSDHPNYTESTKEAEVALKNITGKALKELHAKMIDRRTLVVSVAGDVVPAKVNALVQSTFKKLPQHSLHMPAFGKAKPGTAEFKKVPIPNKASIDYCIGLATGVHNTAEDYLPLMLATQIFGNRGGFTGRLMSTVREQEGLTYGVYAMLSGFSFNRDGYFYVWATFAPQLFQKGKESIRRQFELLITHGVTEEEVEKHKNLFASRAKVQLANSSAYARAAHDCIVDHKDLSYLDELPQKMLELTAREVNAAIKKYMVLDMMSETAAGTFVELDQQSK